MCNDRNPRPHWPSHLIPDVGHEFTGITGLIILINQAYSNCYTFKNTTLLD